MNDFMRLTRRGLLAGMAAASAGGVTLSMARSARADTTLERARKDGYIRVGFANEAPFGYATPEGKLTGEAPEVAKAVLAKMGIAQVDGVLTEFGSLIPGLKAGRFDIIAAGMFINPKRCKEIAFSEPSYGIGQAFLVGKGNPKGLKDYGSVAADAGVKLAVMAGAVEAGYAKESGVKEDQLVVLPDGPSLLAAVQAGRADAAALTALSIQLGFKGRWRRDDRAVRHRRRQVGDGPWRLRLPQGRHGSAGRVQQVPEGLHRLEGASRSRHAVRLRQGLSADQDDGRTVC